MLKDLFINAAILITFVSLSHLLFLRFRIFAESKAVYRVGLGVINGILGITLMLFAAEVPPSILVDFRNIAVIVSAVLGGPAAVWITGSIMLGFRVLYTGIDAVSITAAVVLLVVMSGSSLISILKLKTVWSWILLTAFALGTSVIGLLLAVPDGTPLVGLLSAFSGGTVAVSILMYFYLEYLKKINAFFFQLIDVSSRDDVTGLHNLRQFDRHFKELLDLADENNEVVSLLAIEIDHFGQVTDAFGHAGGDEVLGQVGGVLQKYCRKTDVISRTGGEKFSILLPGCPNEKAFLVAENIRKAVEAFPFVLSGSRETHLTVSIGVATYRETTIDRNRTLGLAESACREAKNAGTNRTVAAAPE